MKMIRRQFAVIIALVITLSIAVPAYAGASGTHVVPNPRISSPGAVIIDFETGIPLFEHNARTQRVPASMIKMVAVHVVLDAIRDGITTMESHVTISQEVARLSRVPGWSNVPLNEGERYTVRELLEVVIVRSANGATAALGEGIFGSDAELIRLMNEKAREYNIRASFIDSFGISAYNRISPLALAWMMRHLIMEHPSVLEFTSMRNVSFRGGDPLMNTNHLLHRYEGADGLKTGFTSAAGFCLIGTAVRDGRRLITVTMGNTLETRYPDTETLLNFGFANAERILAQHTPPEAEPPTTDPLETTPHEPSITTPPTAPPITPSTRAEPSAATLILNEVQMPLSAYMISGYHYFKLRDIAFLLNETPMQFQVAWDPWSRAIHLSSGVMYTADGSELTFAFAGPRPFIPSPSRLYWDGTAHTFNAFLIDGLNFFRLRDLSDMIGFDVEWIGETRTVIINTLP